MFRQSLIRAETRYISAAFQLQTSNPTMSVHANHPRRRRISGYCGMTISAHLSAMRSVSVIAGKPKRATNLAIRRPLSVCRSICSIGCKVTDHFLQFGLVAGFVCLDEPGDLLLECTVIGFVRQFLILLDIG